MERRRFLFDTSAGLWLAAKANGSQAAADSAVRIRIVDAATKKPLVARARLQDARGAEVIPLGRNAQPAKDAVEGDVRFQSRGYFYTDGTLTVRPDVFPLRFTVVRGYEYQIAEGTLRAGAVKDGVATIELQRWSSVGREGYYSGDVHIHHISPKTCRLEMEAEDLDVAHILTSDFTADQHEFEGRLNANSSGGRFVYVSQEFRHDHLGHMCVLDLKKLVEPVKPMQKEHYPLHLSACDRAHAHGGYVTWAHFPSWPGVESPLDVVARLPEEAREVGMRATIADLVEGRPAAAAEAIDLIARDNQDIASAISNAATFRRDGPLIDSTEERIGWWQRRLSPQAETKPVDFLQFVRALGGIRDVTGEIKGTLAAGAKLPPEVYISQRGAARTQRGVEIERAFELAQAEGFVASREEFLAAFSRDKPLLRASDQLAQRNAVQEAEHTALMLKEAGVNPKTRNAFKAAAIVGREQALIAAERGRYAAAQQRIASRLLPDPVEKPEPLAEPGADPLEAQSVGQSQSASGSVAAAAQPKQPATSRKLRPLSRQRRKR